VSAAGLIAGALVHSLSADRQGACLQCGSSGVFSRPQGGSEHLAAVVPGADARVRSLWVAVMGIDAKTEGIVGLCRIGRSGGDGWELGVHNPC